MPDADDAIAATAVALNEDAKAARKRKATTPAEPAAADTQAQPALDLSEGAHDDAMSRMERMATEAILDAPSLVSDIRDFLLDQIKSRPKPWSATSNAEQHDVAASCEHAGTELLRKILEAIAADGKEPVRVLLTKVTLGDDIVIAGKVKTLDVEEENQAVKLLHEARGKHVMLTVASIDDYREDQRDAELDPDQPGLEFAGGTDPDD